MFLNVFKAFINHYKPRLVGPLVGWSVADARDLGLMTQGSLGKEFR